MVIHGLLGTCSLCFQKSFAFLVFMGFEKVLFENFALTLVSVLKSVMKCLFENFCLKSVGAKSIFVLKEKVPENLYLLKRN